MRAERGNRFLLFLAARCGMARGYLNTLLCRRSLIISTLSCHGSSNAQRSIMTTTCKPSVGRQERLTPLAMIIANLPYRSAKPLGRSRATNFCHEISIMYIDIAYTAVLDCCMCVACIASILLYCVMVMLAMGTLCDSLRSLYSRIGSDYKHHPYVIMT